MIFRSLLIPIVLSRFLPCQGEDIFGGSPSSFETSFNDDSLPFLLSAVSDSGVEQCFEGFKLNDLMADPLATVAEYCTPSEAKKFNNALDAFETCSQFDLKQVIETIASAYLGLTLNCGSYVLQAMDLFDNALLGENDDIDLMLSLPRVPDTCVDAFLGDNPFGNMILEYNKYPERELACFTDLANSLPSCTLKEWPVPIVGNWLKSVSCIFGNVETMVEPLMDMMVMSELEQLSGCLPTNISKENCQSVLDSCHNADEPIMSLYLPAPFRGAPLPAKVQQIANDAPQFESALKRYEQYRQSCIPAEDRAIWERDPGKTSQITSNMFEKQSSFQKARSSSTFWPGFITGAILASVGFFALSKVRGLKGRAKPFNNIELNTLELSTEDRFT